MILLNDILRLPDIKNVKVRFNLNFGTKRPAIDYFTDQTEESKQHMLDGQYWNYARKSNFSNGNITLGFVPIPQKQDCWLLFHIGKIVQDLLVFKMELDMNMKSWMNTKNTSAELLSASKIIVKI